MKKTLLTLSAFALFGLNSNAQEINFQTRGHNSELIKKKTGSKEKVFTSPLICNTPYIVGTTMNLNFTLTPATTNGESIAVFALTFPAGITPNTIGSTNPFMAVTFSQPPATIAVSGQQVTWTSGDLTFGGIQTGSTINFTVNVTIASGTTTNKTVSFIATGDGWDGPTQTNIATSTVNGTATILDNSIPFVDAKVVATMVNADHDRNDGKFYSSSNCELSNLPVACRIANLGNTAISNFPVSYQFNGETAVTETVTSTINAGDSLLYYFTTPIATITQDAHAVRSYVTVQSDINFANDTSVVINFTNSISTDLSAGAYTNSLTSMYDLFSLKRGWLGAGAQFGFSTSFYNTAPYGLFFSPSVVGGAPAGTYTSYVLTACVDVVAGDSYVVKYFRKANTSSNPAVTVNGQTAILTGETTVLAALDTIRAFTAITPNIGTGAWELDSTIYVATTSGTRYFAIAGRAQTTGTAQAPLLVGNVRIDDIQVYKLLVPTFVFATTLCSGDSAPSLPTTSTNLITGTWSPAVVDNTTSGTYIFTPSGGQFADTASISITVNGCAGIDEVAASRFVVYPNPANDVISISFSGLMESGVVTLISADGKLIESREFTNSAAQTFDVKSLNSGVYFFQVGNTTQKVIIQ